MEATRNNRGAAHEKASRLPDPDTLKARFAPDRGRMPSIHVAKPLLAGYGTLLDPVRFGITVTAP